MADPINYGGPAFPVPAVYNPMIERIDSAAAYTGEAGMTLRDYFAAKAMAALIATDCWNIEAAGEQPAEAHHVATEAYALADAMIKARTA